MIHAYYFLTQPKNLDPCRYAVPVASNPFTEVVVTHIQKRTFWLSLNVYFSQKYNIPFQNVLCKIH